MNNVQKNTTRLINQYECFMREGRWENGAILPKHERESDAGYTRRMAGFNSPDLYSYLIKTYGVLWAKDPSRDGMLDDSYKLFVDDAGYGMSLSEFLNMSLETAAVLGSVAIVMDADKNQPQSLEGMVMARSWPFLEMVLPQDFTKLVVDRVGRIKAFGYQYYSTADEMQSTLYERVYENGIVTISHKETDEKGKETVVIDSITDYPMGKTPVVFVVPSRQPIVTGRIPSSPTLGLYNQQYSIAVTNSLMDESLYSQQFSVLFATTNRQMQDIKLGTSNILVLDQGDSASFISPSGTPIEMMLKRIDSAVTMMIKTFANMITNGTNQSGEAKNIDRQVGAMQLKNTAEYMQTVEYKIYELFFAFKGVDVMANQYDYTVTYFKDFDMTDIGEYIQNAVDVVGLGVSDDAKMEIRKMIIRKFFAGEDGATVAELIEAESKNKEPVVVDDIDNADGENSLQQDQQQENTELDTLTKIGEPVQNMALNGAQVSSLLEVLGSVSNATLPKESAKSVIRAAFPAISESVIDGMINGITATKQADE